ncbi:GGDEF domain-containing protein [Paenibacillus sp. CAU 1782]
MYQNIRSPEEAASAVLQIANALADIDSLAVCRSQESGYFVIAAVNNRETWLAPHAFLPPFRDRLEPCLAANGRTAAAGCITTDRVNDSVWLGTSPLAESLKDKSLLYLSALPGEGTPNYPGLCLVHSSPIALKPEIKQALSNMASLMAYNADLEAASLTDSLTGLFNRRYLSYLKQNAADRHYSVLFVDLDNFKEMNDRFGHDAGDSILIQVAERLRCNVRKSDVPIRYGGDEFLILFPHLDHEETLVLITNKIAAAMEEPIGIGHSQVHVGISAGSRFHTGGALTLEELIAQADQDMYAAKRKRKS